MASVIHRELSALLSQTHEFEGISIVDVKVSPDCHIAFVSVREGFRRKPLETEAEKRAFAELLNKRGPGFRGPLGRVLQSRQTPELRFEYDFSTEEAEHITGLIDSLRKGS